MLGNVSYFCMNLYVRKMNVVQKLMCFITKRTFRYSLASCLCSSNICFDTSLLGSGGGGRRCGSSIKCTEARSSSSILLSAPALCWSDTPSKSSVGIFGAFLKFGWFIELSIFPVRFRVLLEDDAIAFDMDSVADSLSLLWLLAVNRNVSFNSYSKFGWEW